MQQKTKLSLSRKYIELASFDVNHNYYSNKEIPKIEFIPSIETAVFLKNYKLIFKQESSKITILQEGAYKGEVWQPKIKIDDPKKIVFFLKLNDADFQIKTNVPFYASKDKKFGIVQTNTGIDTMDELRLFDYYFGSFPHQILEDKEALTISLNGEILFEKGPVEEFLKGFKFESGIYEFKFNDNEIIKFLWTGIKLNSDGLVVFDVGQKTDQYYRSLIPNRKIFWEYILVSNYLENLTHCEIIDDQQTMLFDKVENMDNSKNYSAFTSVNEIELRENYTNNLSLEKEGEKLKKLPFPNLKNLTLKKEDVKKRVNKYFLTTYVNL